jgi:hypothetical protein
VYKHCLAQYRDCPSSFPETYQKNHKCLQNLKAP